MCVTVEREARLPGVEDGTVTETLVSGIPEQGSWLPTPKFQGSHPVGPRLQSGMMG